MGGNLGCYYRNRAALVWHQPIGAHTVCLKA